MEYLPQLCPFTAAQMGGRLDIGRTLAITIGNETSHLAVVST
jgi:hypothetical protein